MENSTFVAKSGQAKRAACIVPTCKHLVWNKREQIGNVKGDRAGKITVRKVENSTALDPTAAGGCETLQLLRISQNSCPSKESSKFLPGSEPFHNGKEPAELSNTEELRSKGQEVIYDHHKNWLFFLSVWLYPFRNL